MITATCIMQCDVATRDLLQQRSHARVLLALSAYCYCSLLIAEPCCLLLNPAAQCSVDIQACVAARVFGRFPLALPCFQLIDVASGRMKSLLDAAGYRGAETVEGGRPDAPLPFCIGTTWRVLREDTRKSGKN